ncbi:MAG: hypothetical protein EZS28_024610 [Streblomastix strix]|uniref:Uncharacterized protein n=1 Tax=Streblomastix strix TaxID=222440 RepID=A0A5J4VBQ8_9EUKA|nr:MAG: hypothetical protein EZS28_024610 [Streblomastix strix]
MVFDATQLDTYTNVKIPQQFVLNAGTSTSFAGVTSGNVQINPISNSYDDGLRIGRPDSNGLSSLYLGCSTSTTGTITGQWVICSPNSGFAQNPLGSTIQTCADVSTPNRGLQISADGNTLSFNGQVIAGGSVNYSQGNTILWGTKSTGTEGGFYTDGTTVF